jgi:Ribbon-helix-helix protein, copG family.
MGRKKKDDPWGGNRPGAGRPKSSPAERKVVVTFGLRPDSVKKVDALAKKHNTSRSQALEILIKNFKG